MRVSVRAACLALGLALAACGGGNQAPVAKGPADIATQIDADALALLPAGAAMLITVDTRAFWTSASGAEVGHITEMLLPVGAEAGFSAPRDVDRVTVGVYSMQGADFAAVVNGRFDAAKIDQAVQSHAPTRAGGSIVASSYTGRTLYTAGDVGFTLLTPHTALAGTQTGIRRTLDRLQAQLGAGHVERESPPWMTATLDTKGAAVAAAGDFGAQGVGQIGGLAPWLGGLRMARVLGDFHDPGFNAAVTLTYADGQAAQTAAAGVRQAGQVANVLALTGVVPAVRGLEVSVVESNVQAKFAVDDQSMRSFLQHVPQWIGGAQGSGR